MRKLNLFLVIVFLAMGSVQHLWAGTSPSEFKFPKKIKFKLLKNDRIIGSCLFSYNKQTDKEGISQLIMKNFQGLGFTSREWLTTFIFTKDSSINANFVMKGQTAVSEIKLKKDAKGFDGKKGKIFLYKDLESDNAIKTEIFAKHTVVDLLSMLYVSAKRVALGKKGAEKFNFLIDKSTKIVDMLPLEKENAPFGGKKVTTHVFSFTYQNREMFRVKIFKDSDGYCFPVSVTIVTDFTGKDQPLEIRADKVLK